MAPIIAATDCPFTSLLYTLLFYTLLFYLGGESPASGH